MRRHDSSLMLAWASVSVVLVGWLSPVEAATIEQRVLAGSDDAEQHLYYRGDEDDGHPTNLGSVDITSSDLELGADDPPPDGRNSPGDGPILVGIRWTDLGIPRRATITNAYVQFEVNEEDKSFAFPGEDGSSVLVIAAISVVGQLDPNPDTFAPVPYNISDRPETASRVQWNNIPDWWPIGGPPPVDPAGPDQRTPDLSPIIQEIVNQPGWEAGNALALMFVPKFYNFNRTAHSWDTADTNEPGLNTGPLLHIEWVPEPATAVLASLCMGGLALTRRRR